MTIEDPGIPRFSREIRHGPDTDSGYPQGNQETVQSSPRAAKHLPLPPLRLTGAEILRDGEMQRRSVSLAEGRFFAACSLCRVSGALSFSMARSLAAYCSHMARVKASN